MSVRHWVVVPAAGSGERMAAGLPKQYLPLAGRTVLEWALVPFLEHPAIERVVIVLAASDRYWPALAMDGHPRLLRARGGTTRADSVRSGLDVLQMRADPQDWVLVHDAARPCLARADLDGLLEALADDAAGGLLATPVTDTLKRAGEDQRIAATVSREGLWRALTPQMFRYGPLRDALERCRRQGIMPTDEAAAIESAGLKPRLVAGRTDNIKVTVPEDLELAAQILEKRQEPEGTL